MGDVNASERGQAGYDEAKAALTSMIAEKTVYLDVDDLYIWHNRGTGERVVAIPYADYNSTHYLNVNEAMFLEGYVEKKDYQNEFSPYNWALCKPRNQTVPDFPTNRLVTLLVITLLIVALIY